MMNDDNLYDTLFAEDPDEFDAGLSTIGLMYGHLDFNNISNYYDLEQYNKTFLSLGDKLLSVMHFNIRSFNKNGNEMISLIESLNHQPDILAISESFLDLNSIDNSLLNNYQGFHSVRSAGKRGGVSIFVKPNIDVDIIEEFSYVSEEIEICTVQMKILNKKYTISCIYRPRYKHDKVKEFSAILRQIIQNSYFKKSHTILLGDFNINLLEHETHADTGDFLSMMQLHNFIPLISRPTRFPEGDQNARPSLLDHIYTNFIHQSISGIFHYQITDHLPIFLNMVLPEKPCSTYNVKFRVFTEENKQLFKRELINVTWEEVLSIDNDVNQNYDSFIGIFNRLYNKFFPVKVKNISCKRMLNPWISTGLLNSIRHKNKLYKELKLGLITQAQYSSYRNRTTALVKLTKRNYYLDVFSNFKNSTKKLWQTVNSLSGTNVRSTKTASLIIEDKILTKPDEIAEAFNNHFADIASVLEQKLPQATIDPLTLMRGRYDEPMANPEATIQDFITIVKSLKNKKCNIDDYSPQILKDNANLLAQPVISIFNQSIREGKFPQSLKSARIMPIYKKGPKSNVNNYRPISLLNIFSKIFEKLMKLFLINYIEDCDIISPCQFGFQKG